MQSEGNFDNKGAEKYVGELVQQLTDTVKEILADEGRSALAREGESKLVPSVELIALLCERYNVPPPKEPTVQQWAKKYLQIYDQQIDGQKPERDYKVKRRAVIEKTFRWLESLAQSHWME